MSGLYNPRGSLTWPYIVSRTWSFKCWCLRLTSRDSDWLVWALLGLGKAPRWHSRRGPCLPKRAWLIVPLMEAHWFHSDFCPSIPDTFPFVYIMPRDYLYKNTEAFGTSFPGEETQVQRRVNDWLQITQLAVMSPPHRRDVGPGPRSSWGSAALAL